MPLEIPETLSSVRSLVTEILGHSRPASNAELNAAVNFGYKKGVRALAAVRNQAFQAFVDPFTLTAGVTEYDVGLYDPPVWRPHRLLVGQPDGATRTILFRYRALTSPDFEMQELSRAGTSNTLLYDLLVGRLAGTAVAITATNFAATPSTITVASATQFQAGTLVQIAGAGPTVTYGNQVMPGTYLGVVTNVAGSVLTVQPNFIATPAGASVIPLRRRILKIVPAVNQTLSGRLWYQYRPDKLIGDTDLLDPFLSEHRDLIVYYALSQLLLAVNEADSRRWFEMAQEMRSELMQDLEPLAGQNTEHVDSDQVWGDW